MFLHQAAKVSEDPGEIQFAVAKGRDLSFQSGVVCLRGWFSKIALHVFEGVGVAFGRGLLFEGLHRQEPVGVLDISRLSSGRFRHQPSEL